MMSRALAKSSRVVVPHALKWHERLAAAVIYLVTRLVAGTLRYRISDPHQALTGDLQRNAILCTWHNRLALSLPIYRRLSRFRPPGSRLAALVSASRDGGLLARVLEHFDAQPVRGSSSRRGAQALLELTSWAERGFDLAITPDGPRGPRYSVQEGIIALAQLTGLAIAPIMFNVSPKICLKSWDQFQVPLPFAKCEIVIGRLISVPRDLSDAERAGLCNELEKALLAETRD
jgi:lysophospholipid acyltransferase (LPLAT)-like uncharacterized protein